MVRSVHETSLGFNQTVEKGPSASLRSIALLQRTAQVRLRSSISRAPCIWDLFDRSENRLFQQPVNSLTTSPHLPPHPSLSPPARRLCHNSVHGSTGSPRTDGGRPKINYLAVRPERVEGRTADCDTVLRGRGLKVRGFVVANHD